MNYRPRTGFVSSWIVCWKHTFKKNTTHFSMVWMYWICFCFLPGNRKENPGAFKQMWIRIIIQKQKQKEETTAMSTKALYSSMTHLDNPRAQMKLREKSSSDSESHVTAASAQLCTSSSHHQKDLQPTFMSNQTQSHLGRWLSHSLWNKTERTDLREENPEEHEIQPCPLDQWALGEHSGNHHLISSDRKLYA